MTTSGSEFSWDSPADLLDSIEMLLWRIISGEHVYEDPDGPIFAWIEAGDVDVLGSIYLRALRKALRNAGLDVAEHGEWKRLADEQREPPPLPRERDPRIAAILAEAGHPHPSEPLVPAVAPPAAPAVTVTGALRETALYRWWDEGDVLLYIGISGHLGIRTDAHAAGSSWMEFAVRSTVERYPTRAEAEAAEAEAIKREQPLFNKQHNDTPEARKCLVDYLIKRERFDLLAPAVSRG